MPPFEFILRVEIYCSLPNDGCRRLFAKVDWGRRGTFLNPDLIPEFEGREAWFRVRKLAARKGFEFIEQVEKPSWKD